MLLPRRSRITPVSRCPGRRCTRGLTVLPIRVRSGITGWRFWAIGRSATGLLWWMLPALRMLRMPWMGCRWGRSSTTPRLLRWGYPGVSWLGWAASIVCLWCAVGSCRWGDRWASYEKWDLGRRAAKVEGRGLRRVILRVAWRVLTPSRIVASCFSRVLRTKCWRRGVLLHYRRRIRITVFR